MHNSNTVKYEKIKLITNMKEYSSINSVMEARNHFKNGVSSKNLTSRINIKYIALLLCLFLMQSCFTTRYVSNEAILMKDYKGATVDEIEFELGRPDKKEAFERGYAYTYFYGNRGEMYEKYLFDNNDNLRRIQSTNTVPKKYFSPWKTFGLPFTILGGIIVVGVAIAVGSS